MADKDTGTLKLKTRVVPVTTSTWDYRRGGRFNKGGVSVQFDGDGKGVAPAHLADVFDNHPEFTVGKEYTVTEEVEVDINDERLGGNKSATIVTNPKDDDDS